MQKNTWTNKENVTLRKLYKENLTDEKISSHLPGRTANAIRIQRSILGLVSYTKQKGYKRKQNKPFVRGSAKLPNGTQPQLPFKYPKAKKDLTESAPGKNFKPIEKKELDSVFYPSNLNPTTSGYLTIEVTPIGFTISSNGLTKDQTIKTLALIISKIV